MLGSPSNFCFVVAAERAGWDDDNLISSFGSDRVREELITQLLDLNIFCYAAGVLVGRVRPGLFVLEARRLPVT